MDYLEFARDIVDAAVRAGAHEAEVYLQTGDEFGVSVRMGEIETITQASSKGMGLRVLVDKRMAFASTTDFDSRVVAELIKTTVQLAKAANRDRHNGLPEIGPQALPHMNLYDSAIAKMPAEQKIGMAKECEKGAFDYDPRINNSHGAGFGTHAGTRILANSNGILYSNSGTDCGVSCSPLAEENGTKQDGSYWSSSRFLSNLDSPAEVGKRAALDAVRKLGGRKIETTKAPVVFDNTIASVLWGAVFSALEGDNVHRGMSFLKKKLGKQIASSIVTVIDDPLMPKGLGSMPFDGEGVPTCRKTVIEKGVLNLYFYDTRTANKYGQKPTGNARRGYAGLPSVGPMNFYLQPSETDPMDIVRQIPNGFYVTETIGHGISITTGDFSVGASGMWIKDGELAFPVQEVTIAGNMLDMMKGIEEIGSDIRFASSIVSPTFKIGEMTISGK